MGLLCAPGIWKKPRVVIFFSTEMSLKPWFFDPPSEILRYIKGKKPTLRVQKKSLGRSNGGTTDVNIPNWSLSLEFLQKKNFRPKNHF